jgi:hypothetical protein
MKGITTSAGGMTTVATVDGNTIIMVTMTTDSPMAAPDSDCMLADGIRRTQIGCSSCQRKLKRVRIPP